LALALALAFGFSVFGLWLPPISMSPLTILKQVHVQLR